jgi:hypothetical protein
LPSRAQEPAEALRSRWEAVLLGVDGRSDFNGLHSRRHDDEVQFYAFDMLLSDGEDLRKLPLARPIWPVCWRATVDLGCVKSQHPFIACLDAVSLQVSDNFVSKHPYPDALA